MHLLFADGQKADVWALGCVLYEIMALRPAFTATTMSGLMSKIRGGQFQRSLPACFSEELRALVFSMLAARPDDRPSTSELARHPLLARLLPPADDAPTWAAPAAPAAPCGNFLALPPAQRLGGRLRVESAMAAPGGGLPAIRVQP